MLTRRAFIAVVAGVGGVNALSGFAQPPAKLRRIGFLGLTTERTPVTVSRVEALRAGLRELGYVEGKNIAIEYRWANGDYERLPGLAEELVRLKVEVLVTYSTPGAMAAKKATQTIPIVLASVGDPVSTGVVRNIARPGGNVTGLSMFTPDEMAKRLEILKDAFPAIRRVAVLINPDNLSTRPSTARVEQAAGKLGLEIQIVQARGAGDFEKAIASMVEKRAQAVVVYEDPIFTAEARKLVALAIRNRVPTIGQVSFAEAGGLIGNGANQLDLFRRAAGFVDQILKGARAGDLPIQQPARFELVVNMNTASALGVTIPKTLLFRADRIIE